MEHMISTPPQGRRLPMAALAVVAAGVSAALHVGKLPPAAPALQAALQLSLVDIGLLLSVVQVAGMMLGLAVGLLADGLGLRRGMLAGLALLVGASVLGGCVRPGPHALALLLALRALEGLGFLLAVMPGPALLRKFAPPGTEKAVSGLWGAYMPFGVASALLIGPMLIARVGWNAWWWTLAGASALAMLGLLRWVPPDAASPRAGHAGAGGGPAPLHWLARLGQTLRAAAPRALGMSFAVYASQWMALIGFLPTIYAQAGIPAAWTAVLTALTAAMNIVGNLVGGRLLQRGVPPQRLLRWGFVAMALTAIAAFAEIGPHGAAWSLPIAARYVAVCVFSLCGGMVPATLFLLAMRLAPSPATVSTTVGLMQQASSFGQVVMPPLVAWLAYRVGGWQWTWALMLGCSLAGIALASWLGRLQGRLQQAQQAHQTSQAPQCKEGIRT